jgi:hypothetical protein
MHKYRGFLVGQAPSIYGVDAVQGCPYYLPSASMQPNYLYVQYVGTNNRYRAHLGL